MRIDILSAVPEVLDSYLSNSIVGRAQKNNSVNIEVHNLHQYTDNKFGHIDDYPYGGGAGMLIKCEPIFNCIEKLQIENNYDEIIFLCADGEKLTQSIANELSLMQNIILIAGHYKGIDQRVRDRLVTKEISIGDFVLSGGELPALVLLDSIVRLIPGAIGDAESALDDSFMNGLLEAPQYTRPATYRDMEVPAILLSGNHKKVKEWQEDEAIKKTKERRPDLLK